LAAKDRGGQDNITTLLLRFIERDVVQGFILHFRARPDTGAEGLSSAGLMVRGYLVSRLT